CEPDDAHSQVGAGRSKFQNLTLELDRSRHRFSGGDLMSGREDQIQCDCSWQGGLHDYVAVGGTHGHTLPLLRGSNANMAANRDGLTPPQVTKKPTSPT